MSRLARRACSAGLLFLAACAGQVTDVGDVGQAAGAGGGGVKESGQLGTTTGGTSGTGGGAGNGTFSALAVASDASGDRLVAAGFGGDLWTSTDGGATWVNRTASGTAHGQAWTAVASDASGQNLVAVVDGDLDLVTNPADYDGDIWTSTDGGVTWTNRTASSAAHGEAWAGVASDSTGMNLVAVAAGQGVLGPGDIWTSTDAGATWTNRTASIASSNPDRGWNVVASDTTGKNLVAATNGGDIWTSTDGGATWTDRTPSEPGQGLVGWASVASDASGTRLVAVVDTGDIWTSTDAGVTWVDQTSSGLANNQVWLSVASDAAGMNLVAVDALVDGQNGDIWTSTDGGQTWMDKTTGNAALSQPWAAVASNASGSHAVAVGMGGVWIE